MTMNDEVYITPEGRGILRNFIEILLSEVLLQSNSKKIEDIRASIIRDTDNLMKTYRWTEFCYFDKVTADIYSVMVTNMNIKKESFRCIEVKLNGSDRFEYSKLSKKEDIFSPF